MTTTTTSRPLSPWSPLRVQVFRSLWLASVVSNIGTTMHTVGAAWAMTDLSKNPVVVSLVQTAWAIPGFLVAVPAGVFADVVDRRRLLLICQVTSMVFAAALGVLQISGHLDVPLLLIGTFLLSISLTLGGPAFMALIPDLVGNEELPQAIGLNNISYNGSQSLGPALAGIVIALSGPGAVFMVNAVSFLGIVLVLWRFRPERPGPTSDEKVMAAMWTGLRYFKERPEPKKYAMRIALSFLTTTSMVALLPINARSRLHTTPAQFGLLAAAVGVGAVLAVALLPRLRLIARPDTLVMGAGVLWCTGTTLVAAVNSLPFAVVGVLFTGMAAMAATNITYSMFMLLMPVWIRGRASSVVMLTVWLGASVGGIAWGTIANAIGIPEALLISAALHLLITASVTIFARLEPRTVTS